MRLGFGELLFILCIVLIIFGPSKLPDLGRSLGQAISNFKDGMQKAVVSEENADNAGSMENISEGKSEAVK